MNIIKRISNNKNHYSGKNPCNYITIHETGNNDKGSNALNHVSYINNGSSSTWHYTVDSERVVQHFNDNVQCWHAGDGKGKGNTQSIGIELCVNSDGDFTRTISNAVELVKHLMKKHNIHIENVVQHNKWSGKNCPQNIRSGNPISWGSFKSRLQGSSDVSPASNEQLTFDIENLVQRTIRGEFGNGEERKRKLGSRYQIVQDIINGKTSTPTVNIDDLVQRTIQGEFGNGEERKRKLGVNYQEVQKRVNKLL